MRTDAVATIIGIISLTLLGGCASLTRTHGPSARTTPSAHTPTTPPPPAPAKVATVPQTPAAEEEVLAAVEAFLERTKDFQEASSPPTLGTPLSTMPPASDRPTAQITGVTNVAAAAPQPAERAPTAAYTNSQVTIRENSAESMPARPVVKSVVVASPLPEVARPAPMAVPSNATNEPLDITPATAPMDINGLIAQLETQAQEADEIDAEWRLRLVQLAMNRDADAEAVSATVSPEHRGMLASLVRVGTAIRGLMRDPLLSGRQALERIEELQRVVADRADPIVSAVALCRRVVTFGVYEEMGPMTFVAGRNIQTIVYSEVANFSSEETEDGKHRTRLATRLELLTTDGDSVWKHEEPEIVDECRRRRHDFFIAQRITLPSTLAAGEYVLKVMVEDQLSGKADETTYPLTIRESVTSALGG